VTATALYRTAAAIFVLFAAGHTFGFLTFTPPSAKGIAVRDAMNNVHFAIDGATFSYGNFYRGFGLSITASMLFSAFLAWQLGALVQAAPRAAASIAWGFCALQLAGFALSCIYISLVPALFSLAVAACLGFAAWRSMPRGRAAQLVTA
jgi:hypothetical protein